MSRLLSILLLCIAALSPALAADLSPTLPELLRAAQPSEKIAVIAFLDNRLTMEEVYPEARALPMSQRRDYVVRVLKERFAQVSPDVMRYLKLEEKAGRVSLLRPLWVLNAIRLTTTREVIEKMSSDYAVVTYIVHDPAYDNTLDIGWGVSESGAVQVWNQFGATGEGVIVGHKDSGVNFEGCSRFDNRIWFNPGEDLNGNGSLDVGEENGVDDDANGYVDDFWGWNFDDDINNVQDNNGHGTRTASVISSNPLNTVACDTVAMAPGAKLMVLLGYVTQGATFESSQYAIEKGANVVSASLSFKQNECTSATIRECPNRVAHRWVAEMELAAGIIHANSTGNDDIQNPRPLSTSAPSDCPPPAMTPWHSQQGGVSSVVAVAAYNANGTFGAFSGVGPAAWSRADLCVQPRSPWCGADGTPSMFPEDFNDYPYSNGNHGLLKPDITSPSDVNAVSANCGCSFINGTSGATPHVGGALALIYSAFPGITPEDAYLTLVYGALDAGDIGPDTTWGFGKLRIHNAIAQSDDSLGSVAGNVSHDGQPLANVRIRVEGAQTVYTSEGGNYELFLRPGTYLGAFEKFGYQTVQRQINIAAGQVDDGNLTLNTGQAASVIVTVRDLSGNPITGVLVRHPISGMEVLTNDHGSASFAEIYDGMNEFVISENDERYQVVTISHQLTPGPNSFAADLPYSSYIGPTAPDVYGYRAYDDLDGVGVDYDWMELADGLGANLGLSGDGFVARTLPFNMQFYGAATSQIQVSANGHIEIGSTGSNEWSRWPIPRPESPNNYIAGFYQDLRPEMGGGVWYYEDDENHRVIVEWNDAPEYFNTGRVTFQIHLYDPAFVSDTRGNSLIEIHYADYQGRVESSIGIENADGTDGLQYAFQLFYADGAAPVRAGRAIRFTTDNLTDVPDGSVVTPREYALLQNYPNPFNATTTFRYSVPQQSIVALRLYDITGRLVATLAQGVRAAGTHSLNYDASNLATGLYFVRLEANGSVVGTNKVLLLK
ncbi:MAG: S8 family serine peptidase [bacterium]|nr:S8 family serine peptidase [bacterium]